MPYEETLSLLSSLVPVVPGIVQDLLEQAEALQVSARELLARIEQKRIMIDQGQVQVHEALAGLRNEAASQLAEQEAAWTAVDTALERAAAGLESDRSEVTSAAEKTVQAFTSLASELKDAGADARAAAREVGKAIDEVATVLQAGRDELETAVGEATTFMADMQMTVEIAQTKVTEELNDLDQHLDTTLEKARGRLGQAVEAIRALQREHEAHIAAMGQRVTDNKEELDKETSKEVDDVRAAVVERVDGVLLALTDLDRALGEAQEGSKAHREGIEPLFQDLEKAMEPLPAAIDSVKQAAARVGLAWP